MKLKQVRDDLWPWNEDTTLVAAVVILPYVGFLLGFACAWSALR